MSTGLEARRVERVEQLERVVGKDHHIANSNRLRGQMVQSISRSESFGDDFPVSFVMANHEEAILELRCLE